MFLPVVRSMGLFVFRVWRDSFGFDDVYLGLFHRWQLPEYATFCQAWVIFLSVRRCEIGIELEFVGRGQCGEFIVVAVHREDGEHFIDVRRLKNWIQLVSIGLGPFWKFLQCAIFHSFWEFIVGAFALRGSVRVRRAFEN